MFTPRRMEWLNGCLTESTIDAAAMIQIGKTSQIVHHPKMAMLRDSHLAIEFLLKKETIAMSSKNNSMAKAYVSGASMAEMSS